MAAELAARQHAPQIVVDYMSRHPRSVSSASLQQISYRSCAFSLARVEFPAGASESVTSAVLVTQGGWLDVGICKRGSARSRLYRSQHLQVNTRLKALDEIYKIYILLHQSDLKILAKIPTNSFSQKIL